ncbi:MAG: MauE/DoxX family redox-associated membrane protein, partial [Flavobacteriales bacterium]
MRALLLFSRIFVGSLFIVSGLIKANDPLGFSYKLEEYFAESALGLTGLEPYALTLAVLACLGEIVLGFALLFGGRMKLATVSLLVLTLFFGWLTAFTARCNDRQAAGNPMTFTISVNGVEQTQDMTCVTDCGCFGDAMKGSVGRSLTPWESFTKDAVLFVFLLPILFAAWRGNGIGWNTAAEDKVLLPGGLLFVAAWSWVFTWWGPVLFT